MLAIARALATGPRLLLLDEPSQGLAPVIVDAVISSVEAMRDEGLAILLVEQNVELALRRRRPGRDHRSRHDRLRRNRRASCAHAATCKRPTSASALSLKGDRECNGTDFSRRPAARPRQPRSAGLPARAADDVVFAGIFSSTGRVRGVRPRHRSRVLARRQRGQGYGRRPADQVHHARRSDQARRRAAAGHRRVRARRRAVLRRLRVERGGAGDRAGRQGQARAVLDQRRRRRDHRQGLQRLHVPLVRAGVRRGARGDVPVHREVSRPRRSGTRSRRPTCSASRC